MASQCVVNCSENPDSVDKIEWKCVECGTNLEKQINKVFAEREEAAKESEKIAAENEKGQLTEEEKAHRRSMAE